MLSIKMASWRDDLILEGEFHLVPKKKGTHKVALTRCGLYVNLATNYSVTYEEKSLLISDIVGCHCLEYTGGSVTGQASSSNNRRRSYESENDGADFASSPSRHFPKATSPTSVGFSVFAYPFRKKMFSGKKVRHRVVFAFEIPSLHQDDLQERKKTAEKWRNIINCLSWNLSVNQNDLSSYVPPPRGRLLLLINPFSGPGKALQIFRNEVAPVLYESCIPYKAIVTEYAGHASDLVKTLTMSEWYGIVIVSGDGLIFETINGIMQRDDWASSIKLPVGCVPGGSGNALCCAINYAAGEPLDSSMVLHSTFLLVKHRVVPMDLVVVHIPDKTLFSFLSVTWGIMADIDFESEKYRNLGEARFTVGAIKRIIGLRTYRGRISFLPVAEYVPKESANSSKVLSKIRRFSLRSRSSSKSTINSIDSREGDSPQLLSHRSLTMESNDNQFYLPNGDAVMNGSVVTDAGVNISTGNAFKGDEDSELHNSSELGYGDGKVQPAQEHRGASIAAGEGGAGDAKTGNTIDLKDADSRVHDTSATIHQQLHSNEDNSVEFVNKAIANSENSQSADSEIVLARDTKVSNGTENVRTDSTDNSRTLQSDKSDNGSEMLSARHEISNNYAGGGCEVERSNCNMTILSETEEIGVEEETYHGRKADFAPVPTPLLPPLDQDLPSNWVSLEGEFILAAAVYQTHLGSDMLAAPDAHLHDGHIHLMIVKEGISRNALLNLFMSFGQGSHVHSPYVESVKVLAFRLEPETTNGNIMVDGERFDPSPIQGQILPGVARIMAIK